MKVKLFVFCLITILGVSCTRNVYADSSYSGMVQQLQEIQEYLNVLKINASGNQLNLSSNLNQLLASTRSVNITKDWDTIHAANAYSVSYPKGKGWYADDSNNSRVVFGKSANKNDFIWSIYSYEKSTSNEKEIIAEIGKQFTDRKVTKRKIKVDGLPATLVKVTTKSHPNWEAISVFVNGKKAGHTDKIFVISNGAVKNSDFTKFYKSIKFVKSESIKKDTSVAKDTCTSMTLYGFSYYKEPSKNVFCYKNSILEGADANSFFPLEAISKSNISKLVQSTREDTLYFGFDKNNFYINGKIKFSEKKKNFKLISLPKPGMHGEIMVNDSVYTVVMTGLVGATLK